MKNINIWGSVLIFVGLILITGFVYVLFFTPEINKAIALYSAGCVLACLGVFLKIKI